MSFTAQIITIGDEILLGKTLDTNSFWIANQLTALGFKVTETLTIADEENDILSTVEHSLSKSDLIIITGGLGPTKDDITKHALTKFFKTELKVNEQRLNELENFYHSKGRELNELNKTQALLPLAAHILTNSVGTANGMLFAENNKVVVSLPGVPHEMKHILTEYGLTEIQKRFNLPNVVFKEIKTVGIPESDLAIKLQGFENNLPENIKIAYLPSLGMVKIRLTTISKIKKQGEISINKLVERLIDLIPNHIYGYDNDSLEDVIGKLLIKKGYTLSTAESCTGGNIGKQITSIPGSSKYYSGGIIAYQNTVKENLLSVNPETLQKHGAVSKETVSEMAKGIRSTLASNIGIATTGIAGPDGGSVEKPVGTVWIAIYDGNSLFSKKLTLGKNRKLNIQMSTTLILYNLWKFLKGYLNQEEIESTVS